MANIMTLPMRIDLAKGERGLFCKFAEAHNSPKRKIYFPDRSCAKNLCEGPAIITAVRDMGTYGFFQAEMVQFTAPSDGELVQIIYESRLLDRTLQFKSGKFGSFVLVDDQPLQYALVTGTNGKVERNYMLPNLKDSGSGPKMSGHAFIRQRKQAKKFKRAK